MIIPVKTIIDGRYEIISLMGSGGLGSVYKANQLNLNRLVAIKVLHVSVATEVKEQQRLHREAMVLSELHHGCIVSFYGYGVWNSFPYIVMEFVEGEPLQTFLNDGKPLPLDFCVDVGKQICSALEAAHVRGIVHRDLKPVNIMVQESAGVRQVKLIDFGLAKLLPEFGHEIQRLTQTGSTVGSVMYMSPEQCAGAKEIDGRTDVYALGAVLYHCLSGEAPFAGTENFAVMIAQMKERPRSLSKVHSTVEPCRKSFDRVLGRALAKNPSERYQNATELAQDLARVATGAEPASVQSLSEVKAYRSKSAPAISKHSIVVLGVVVMSCMVAAYWTMVAKQSAPSPMVRPDAGPIKSAHERLRELGMLARGDVPMENVLADALDIERANKDVDSLSRIERGQLDRWIMLASFRLHDWDKGAAVLTHSLECGQSSLDDVSSIVLEALHRAPESAPPQVIDSLSNIARLYIKQPVVEVKTGGSVHGNCPTKFLLLDGIIRSGSRSVPLSECGTTWLTLDRTCKLGADRERTVAAFAMATAYARQSNPKAAVEWLANLKSLPLDAKASWYGQTRRECAQALALAADKCDGQGNTSDALSLSRAGLKLVSQIEKPKPTDDLVRMSLLARLGDTTEALSLWPRLEKNKQLKFTALGQLIKAGSLMGNTGYRFRRQLDLYLFALATDNSPFDLQTARSYCWLIRMAAESTHELPKPEQHARLLKLVSLAKNLGERESETGAQGACAYWTLSNTARSLSDFELAEELRDIAVDRLLSRKVSEFETMFTTHYLWADYCLSTDDRLMKEARVIWSTVNTLISRLEKPDSAMLLRRAVAQASLDINDDGVSIVGQVMADSHRLKLNEGDCLLMLKQYRQTLSCQRKQDNLRWFDDCVKITGRQLNGLEDATWVVNMAVECHQPLTAIEFWQTVAPSNPARLQLLCSIVNEMQSLSVAAEKREVQALVVPKIIALKPAVKSLAPGDYHYLGFALLQAGHTCKDLRATDRKVFEQLLEMTALWADNTKVFNQNGYEAAWVLGTWAERDFGAATAEKTYSEALRQVACCHPNDAEARAFMASLIGWCSYSKALAKQSPCTMMLARHDWQATELLFKKLSNPQVIDIARLAVCEESLGSDDCGAGEIEKLLSRSRDLRTNWSEVGALLQEYRQTTQAKHEPERMKWFDAAITKAGIKLPEGFVSQPASKS